MRILPLSLVAALAFVVGLSALAGESPYRPGGPSNAEVLRQMPMSYYCTAQGNGESKWYVTGFETAPSFGTPGYQTFQGDSSQAFTQYMNATYGRARVLYPHCTVGPSKGLRSSWEQMQHDARFREIVHVSWRFGQSSATAATDTSAD